MKRETAEKILLTVILVGWYFLLPSVGYQNGDTDNTYKHILYMWSHANIWHMAGNLFILWIMRGKLHLIPSLLIAFIVSFIPAWSIYGDLGITMGFSGVLFAIYGIKWGVYCKKENIALLSNQKPFNDFLTKVLPLAIIGIIIPNINWCLHTYCILSGFIYGRWK